MGSAILPSVVNKPIIWLSPIFQIILYKVDIVAKVLSRKVTVAYHSKCSLLSLAVSLDMYFSQTLASSDFSKRATNEFWISLYFTMS